MTKSQSSADPFLLNQFIDDFEKIAANSEDPISSYKIITKLLLQLVQREVRPLASNAVLPEYQQMVSRYNEVAHGLVNKDEAKVKELYGEINEVLEDLTAILIEILKNTPKANELNPDSESVNEPELVQAGSPGRKKLIVNSEALPHAGIAEPAGQRSGDNRSTMVEASRVNEVVALPIPEQRFYNEISRQDSEAELDKILITAAEKNYPGIIEVLSCHMNIAKKFSGNETALHFAARNNSVEAMEILVDLGTPVDATTYSGSQPIHYLAQANDVSEAAFSFLLKEGGKKGIDLMQKKNSEGETPLHVAAKNGQAVIAIVNACKTLRPSKKFPEYLNASNKYGDRPIHIAARNNQDGAVEILANSGADFKLLNNAGSAPIHIAADLGHVAVINALSKLEGFDPNFPNEHGNAPINIAAHNPVAIDALLKVRANINKTGSKGLTAFQSTAGKAAENFATGVDVRGELEAAKFLQERGANVKILTDKGDSLIHIKAQRSAVPALEFLINNFGFEISDRNSKGQTVLHVAAEAGNFAVVEYLLKNGAEVNAKDGADKRAIDLVPGDNPKLKSLINSFTPAPVQETPPPPQEVPSPERRSRSNSVISTLVNAVTSAVSSPTRK